MKACTVDNLARFQEVTWEGLSVSKEFFCTGFIEHCVSQPIVASIKGRKVWVCGREGKSDHTRGHHSIPYNIIFISSDQDSMKPSTT